MFAPHLSVKSKGELWALYSQEAMPVTIPDEVLGAAHISEPELKQELALTLFRQERLSLGQASRLAEMT